MLYGAVIGDIVGSRFEFDMGGKTKNFKLFDEECEFTDDSVMSVAVASALIKAGYDADEDTIKFHIIKAMQAYGRKYPDAGYGSRFIDWLFAENPEPYNSWGNGSAMRVSSVGWLYTSLERTLEVAKYTAEVSHNHPEGIKGAECTAAVIFLSRIGRGKTEIKKYVRDNFGYDLDTSVDELRSKHRHDESCQDTLPKALVSFFEGISFEDVVRNAVSLGGDADTIGAIAGAMAEAYYGVPEEFKNEVMNYLDDNLKRTLNSLEDIFKDDEILNMKDEERRNMALKIMCEEFGESLDQAEAMFRILSELAFRALDDGEARTPCIDVNNVTKDIDPDKLIIGGTYSFDKEVRLRVDVLRNEDGITVIPLYTDEKEIDYSKTANITINWKIRLLIEDAYKRDDVDGLLINPFSSSIYIPKQLLKMVVDRIENKLYS